MGSEEEETEQEVERKIISRQLLSPSSSSSSSFSPYHDDEDEDLTTFDSDFEPDISNRRSTLADRWIRRICAGTTIFILLVTAFTLRFINNNTNKVITGTAPLRDGQVNVTEGSSGSGNGVKQDKVAVPTKQTQTVTVNGKEVTIETQSATWEDQSDDDPHGNDDDPHETKGKQHGGPRWEAACPPSKKNVRQRKKFHTTTTTYIAQPDFNMTNLEATTPNHDMYPQHDIGETVAYYPIQYQCVGDEYNDFTKHTMKDYAQHYVDAGHRSQCWGKRWNSIPNDKRVLMIGNSHLMQVARSMMAYAGLQVITNFSLTYTPGNGKLAVVKFDNGAELNMLGNYPGVAAIDLEAELNDVLGSTLDSYDAVIMGIFNE